MNYRDLVFGDWVRVIRGYDKHVTYERIKGVLGDENEPYPVRLFTGETVSLNDIEPIPLSVETLEDNLFFQDHKYFILSITKKTRVVLKCIDEEQNKWYAGIITVFDDIAHAHIKYFHQLQHLLWENGIKKEIRIHQEKSS